MCGGGAAGIAAARAGPTTRLVEANGCLGGTWTAGLLSWILDSGSKPGLMREILDRLKKAAVSRRYGRSVGDDVEGMKLLLDEMCLAAGGRCRGWRGSAARRP